MKVKMTTLALLLGLLFLGVNTAFTQTSEEVNSLSMRKLSISLGKVYNIGTDYTWARIPQEVKTTSVSLYYEKISPQTMSGFYIILPLPATGQTPNALLDLSQFTYYNATVAYRKLRKINDDFNNFSLYAGGGAGLRADIWFPTTILNYGWDINLGLNAAFSARYVFAKRLYAQYDLDLGLLGVLLRTPNNGQQLVVEEASYAGGVAKAVYGFPRLGHLFNAVYADNRIKLGWAISKKLDLYAGSNINYRYIKVPLIKTGYLMNNHVGISFKF